MRKEIWKVIPGYEGLYEVSDIGNVRHTHRNHLKKQTTSDAGYKVAWLSKQGKLKGKLVHLLVLLAFVGPRPEGMQTRHLNGKRTDNRLDNLKYGTCSENRQDMMLHGTIPRGENFYSAKLKENDIKFIRNNVFNYSDGYLAKIYGVTPGTIQRAKEHSTWKCVS